jgi:energy-coupling factor transporter ATP-binding protein EcfA2
MRVIHLVAENVKKLVAIDITPEGQVVEITGQNGAGKTSVLDAIWWALAGERVIQSQPIREGEEKARIRLDLGEFVVTRRFNAREGGGYTTEVRVENMDGQRIAKPQTMLDALVGSLSFDPLAFARSDAKAQFEELKRLTGLDFTELEAANKQDYDARTSANRLAKELRALLGPPIEDAPAEPVDEDQFTQELRDAATANADIERRRQNRENAEARIAEIVAEEKKLMEERHALQTRLAQAPALPQPTDPQTIISRLETAKAANRRFQLAAERAKRLTQVEAVEKQAADLSAAIEARNETKRKAISDVEMPVEGLGFGPGHITLADQPFDQASDAEQLRASVAIAAAMNPKLRVIRVRDGSLLDDTSMSMLADFAAERDYQVWIEVVDSDRPGAIVIEEGRVAGVISGDGDEGGGSKTQRPQSDAPRADKAKPSSASASPAPGATQGPEGSTLLMPGLPLNGGDAEDDELEF